MALISKTRDYYAMMARGRFIWYRSWPGCCCCCCCCCGDGWLRGGHHLLLWHSLGSQQAAHSAAVESQSHAAQSCAKVLWRGAARSVGCLFFVQPLKYRKHPDRREQSFARLKSFAKPFIRRQTFASLIDSVADDSRISQIFNLQKQGIPKIGFRWSWLNFLCRPLLRKRQAHGSGQRGGHVWLT